MILQDVFSWAAKIPRSITGSLSLGFHLILFITVICVFVPFSPIMPEEGLDPSWVFGMNQAVAQGFVFGRDLIFTFGPYASIYTKTYHPATDHLMLVGALYLSLSYGLVVFLVTRNGSWYLLVMLWVVLAGLMYSRDSLLFSYPLLVGLFCFKSVNLQERIGLCDKFTLTITTILFLPFGLLPLIKGSVLLLCSAIAVLAITLFAANKKWSQVIAVIVSPVVSIFFFWVISGQSIINLPSYFLAMLQIISGYSEAMAINGKKSELVYYLIISFALLITILRDDSIALKPRVFIFFLFFIYLFLVFKGGFVRHDGHAIMSSTSILFASLLLVFTFSSRKTQVILFFSVLLWVNIDRHYINTSTESIYRNIKFTYSSTWSGLKNRITKKDWLENGFNNAVNRLDDKSKFPLLHGATDIYSYNQSYLIASNNKWIPRPILQSYSVYTPYLSQINKNHLLGAKAPDNVIFKVEPIDGRMPSIEDGASWPVLLTNFQPTALGNDFLYLHKNPLAAKETEEILIGKASYSFGDEVVVPNVSVPIFAEISVKKSTLGKLINILYKPSQLQISLNLESDSTKKYRLISGMAKPGFLISPLIENTNEFGLLYGGMDYLPGKKVKSFSISPINGKQQWEDTYEVTFKKVMVSSRIEISKLYKLDRVYDRHGNYKVSLAETCDGSIDFLNGFSPAPAQFSASGLLNVHGWLAKSVERGSLPESVILVLSDSEGKNTFVETRQTLRPDVGAHFKNPTLEASGYASTAVVSAFRGEYTLSLAYTEGGYIKLCPQPKIFGNFKGITSHDQR